MWVEWVSFEQRSSTTVTWILAYGNSPLKMLQGRVQCHNDCFINQCVCLVGKLQGNQQGACDVLYWGWPNTSSPKNFVTTDVKETGLQSLFLPCKLYGEQYNYGVFVAGENTNWVICLRSVWRREPVGHHRPSDRSERRHLGLGLSWSFVSERVTRHPLHWRSMQIG